MIDFAASRICSSKLRFSLISYRSTECEGDNNILNQSLFGSRGSKKRTLKVNGVDMKSIRLNWIAYNQISNISTPNHLSESSRRRVFGWHTCTCRRGLREDSFFAADSIDWAAWSNSLSATYVESSGSTRSVPRAMSRLSPGLSFRSITYPSIVQHNERALARLGRWFSSDGLNSAWLHSMVSRSDDESFPEVLDTIWHRAVRSPMFVAGAFDHWSNVQLIYRSIANH